MSKPYLYETHLHTAPVSRCAKASVEQTLAYYKSLGYAGVCITNHFIDGNINIERDRPYEERIRFFCSDYENAEKLGLEMGISVFFGIEMSYGGTDFLVYGIDKAWLLAHPEIDTMSIRDKLTLMADAGAFIVQAHPYREARYIECIRLFPRHVHAVEIYNASQPDLPNDMARHYAASYGLIPFAGSDNHWAEEKRTLGGVMTDRPLDDIFDFIQTAKEGKMTPFIYNVDENPPFSLVSATKESES